MNREAPLRTLISGCAIAVLVLAASACAPKDPTLPAGAPPAHSVVKGGVAHMDGLYSPYSNCARCHGHDLTGGADNEPSCFSCHEQNW